jgi:hypothetical protein
MISPRNIRLCLAATIFLLVVSTLTLTYNLDRTGASAKAQQAEKAERQLENQIPQHIPLRVKIKREKEKEFKDLTNDKWARDFELEITNTGTKPIYALSLLLWLPDVKTPGGSNISFPLNYGRTELGDIREKARLDDIPISSGETIVLKIHPANAAGWEIGQKEEHRPEPKRIELIFQILSFGDGTGFAGDGGVALPRKLSGQSKIGSQPQSTARSGPLLTGSARSSGKLSRVVQANLPARLLPVNFFGAANGLSCAATNGPVPDSAVARTGTLHCARRPCGG